MCGSATLTTDASTVTTVEPRIAATSAPRLGVMATIQARRRPDLQWRAHGSAPAHPRLDGLGRHAGAPRPGPPRRGGGGGRAGRPPPGGGRAPPAPRRAAPPPRPAPPPPPP